MIYQDVIYVYKGDEKRKVHQVDKQGWLENGWKTEKDPQPSEGRKTLKLDNTTPAVPMETRKRTTKEPE